MQMRKKMKEESNMNKEDINKILYPHDFSDSEALRIDPIIKSKVNDPEVIRFL